MVELRLMRKCYFQLITLITAPVYCFCSQKGSIRVVCAIAAPVYKKREKEERVLLVGASLFIGLFFSLSHLWLSLVFIFSKFGE